MPVDETQKKARNKWDAENMTVLGCKIRKDRAEEFKTACKEAGTTPNSVFSNAISDFMEGKAQTSADLSPEDQRRVDQHIEKTGETAPAFVTRAINDTIDRDNALFKMGMKPMIDEK